MVRGLLSRACPVFFSFGWPSYRSTFLSPPPPPLLPAPDCRRGSSSCRRETSLLLFFGARLGRLLDGGPEIDCLSPVFPHVYEQSKDAILGFLPLVRCSSIFPICGEEAIHSRIHGWRCESAPYRSPLPARVTKMATVSVPESRFSQCVFYFCGQSRAMCYSARIYTYTALPR